MKLPTKLEDKLLENTSIQLFWNLTKKCYSIRLKTVKGWRLAHHTRYTFLIKDVTFKVSTKGRERVRREQKKYVHAFIAGKLTYITGSVSNFELQNKEVTYNPYKDQNFVLKLNRDTEVLEADYCLLSTYLDPKDGKIKPCVVI
jgi:hypothetical protein